MATSHVVTLEPHQTEFVTSEAKFPCLITGIGSGKTFAGVHYVLRMITKYPDALGLIAANTHAQLRDSVLAKLFAECDRLNIQYDYNQYSGHVTIAGTKIKVTGLENFNSLRGIEIGWGWCDEIRDLNKEAWDMLIGRLRDKRGPLQLCATTSPAGFGWVYDLWEDEEATPKHHRIHATSMDNPHLPEDYLEAMKDYDPLFYDQEVLGKTVNLVSGQAYRAYDTEINDTREEVHLEGRWLDVGMDFNVSPMTATISVIEERTRTVFTFDEIYLPVGDTFAMVEAIKEKYPNHKIRVTPDSTGNARKTSSSMTDHEILRQAGFTVLGTANPPVTDRINTANGLLWSKRWRIHKRCVMLRRDLRQVIHGKNPEHLTHISDAAGYTLFNYFPLRTNRGAKVFN